ncbi:MAG: CAP domain-containing protein [Chloroflexales bacterium]
MKRSLWIAAALIIVVLGIRPAARAERLSALYSIYLPFISQPGTPVQTVEQRQMADQVLALVNSERATAGCAALTMNDKLIAAAQGQSQDMAVQNFFSHTNPDPNRATLSQRVNAVGYTWSSIGENIAAGQNTPADVMTSWMNSPGHKANILNCAYTEIGVGYFYQADDQPLPGDTWSLYYYWTQVFGQP